MPDDTLREEKPWAEPGFTIEERAGRMFDRLGVAMDPSNPGSDWQEIEAEIAEALRAAEQAGYVRGFDAAEGIFAPRKTG